MYGNYSIHTPGADFPVFTMKKLEKIILSKKNKKTLLADGISYINWGFTPEGGKIVQFKKKKIHRDVTII